MQRDYNLLKEVLSVPTKTYQEGLMIEFITNWLDKNELPYYTDSMKNIYVTKQTDENAPVGRPREKMSVIGTNADPVGGRDRLGVQGMKGGYPSDNENVRESMTNTHAVYLRNKSIFKAEKRLIFEKQEEISSDLLNETNIKDLDN